MTASDQLKPGRSVTFTVARIPRRRAQCKTIERLMGMNPRVQGGLKTLNLHRRREDNETYRRAGKDWTSRVRATRLTRCEPGTSFTLRLTPQILPDVRSVAAFLEASPARSR